MLRQTRLGVLVLQDGGVGRVGLGLQLAGRCLVGLGQSPTLCVPESRFGSLLARARPRGTTIQRPSILAEVLFLGRVHHRLLPQLLEATGLEDTGVLDNVLGTTTSTIRQEERRQEMH